jgi:septal ring factor EnvC (AmiA/AmiB activator)
MSQSFPEFAAVAEAKAEQQAHEAPADGGALALSADDFSALEERILRAVELVKQERQARTAAEDRAAKAEEQLREQTGLAEQLHSEINALRSERNHVRQRVDRLLAQLDAIEL